MIEEAASKLYWYLVVQMCLLSKKASHELCDIDAMKTSQVYLPRISKNRRHLEEFQAAIIYTLRDLLHSLQPRLNIVSVRGVRATSAELLIKAAHPSLPSHLKPKGDRNGRGSNCTFCERIMVRRTNERTLRARRQS